jgi:hypothetical protein
MNASRVTGPERLTQERAARLFDRIVDLHAGHDPRAVAAVFTADAVYDDASWPAPARGHDEIARLLTTVWRAFPDFRVELVSGPFIAEDGSGFAVRGRVVGTMTGPLDPPGLAPTHTTMSTEYAGFYRFEGEQLRYGRVILDTSDVASQLAALPPPGSPGERLGVWLQRLQARRLRRRRGQPSDRPSPRDPGVTNDV